MFQSNAAVTDTVWDNALRACVLQVVEAKAPRYAITTWSDKQHHLRALGNLSAIASAT